MERELEIQLHENELAQHTCIPVLTPSTHCFHLEPQTHMHTHMHTHTHTQSHTQTHTLIHTLSYIHSHTHSFIHTLSHTLTQTHLHTCIHSLIHTHTHTHTAGLWKLMYERVLFTCMNVHVPGAFRGQRGCWVCSYWQLWVWQGCWAFTSSHDYFLQVSSAVDAGAVV